MRLPGPDLLRQLLELDVLDVQSLWQLQQPVQRLAAQLQWWLPGRHRAVRRAGVLQWPVLSHAFLHRRPPAVLLPILQYLRSDLLRDGATSPGLTTRRATVGRDRRHPIRRLLELAVVAMQLVRWIAAMATAPTPRPRRASGAVLVPAERLASLRSCSGLPIPAS